MRLKKKNEFCCEGLRRRVLFEVLQEGKEVYRIIMNKEKMESNKLI